MNPYRNSRCEICGTVASASKFEDLNDISTDLDPLVGSVFFPLKTCSGKRKWGDPAAPDGCDDNERVEKYHVGISEFREIKACNAGVAGENFSA